MPPIGRRGTGSRAAQNISGIIDAILKSRIQERSQIRQSELIAQRQAEMDARLAERQRQQEAQRQTGERAGRVSDILGGIDSAKTLEELPTSQGLQTRLGMEGVRPSGPIGPQATLSAMQGNRTPSVVAQADAARQAKDAAIRAELGIAEDAKPRILSSGVEGFLSRGGGQEIATERTAEQEGERARASSLGGDLHPDILAAEARKVGQTESARTRAGIQAEAGLLPQIRDIAAAKREPKDETDTNVLDTYRIERVERTIQSVDELIPQINSFTVGPGAALSIIPGTPSKDFAAQLETLKANIAFGELTEMRAASKTGGALGQVSDREGVLLQSALGALDIQQSPASFKTQLNKVKASLERWKQAQAQEAERRKVGIGGPQTQASPDSSGAQNTWDAASRQLMGGN